jgi:hypothetical protein
MTTEETFSSLAAKSSDIALFCKIAAENGETLSLREVILLASLDMNEDDLAHEWTRCDYLNSAYQIVSQRIMQRTNCRDDDLSSELSNHRERSLRATTNVNSARRFARWLRDKNLRLACISGSTSYLSVSIEDDLDFFIVAKRDRMWISFVRALILARVFRLMEKSPQLCLSYVADEGYARLQFSRQQDALFARDAISASVILGEGYYARLLKNGYWMARFFPKMYSLRLENHDEHSPMITASSSRDRIANLFLYHTAGAYIRLKSYLLNRKYSKAERRNSEFVVKIGTDHCIYESQSYVHLRKMYRDIRDQGNPSK